MMNVIPYFLVCSICKLLTITSIWNYELKCRNEFGQTEVTEQNCQSVKFMWAFVGP